MLTMIDLKLEYQQAILKRMQDIHSDRHQNLVKSDNRTRPPTDFSINRILGHAKSIKNAHPIDLSKSNQVTCKAPNLNNTMTISTAITPLPTQTSASSYHQQGRTSILTSENLVKPKVYKFWDINALSSCNGCDRYFKNFAFPNLPSGAPNSFLWGRLPQVFPQHNDILERFVMQSVAIDVKCSKERQPVDDEISYKCEICDKVFGCANTLEAHERTHKTPRYECLDCGKGFSQLRNYKYHLSVHRGTKEFAAECPECGKTFNDKGYLSSHMKIHRNKKEYECPYCPKSFNQRVAFNMHVRIHTGVKPHKCTECGKRFSRKMLLKQHMRTHSGEKPYQCSVCGKSFADRSNMTLHHRLHSGIKPFACPICPKAFTKKHHLKTHLNYHTGCKPYQCPHPNCNQAFTQSSNMRTHAKKCQYRPIIETDMKPIKIL